MPLTVLIDDDGKVVAVKELSPDGKIKPVKYGAKEKKAKKTMEGARLMTPNPCCWVKINDEWVCVPCG